MKKIILTAAVALCTTALFAQNAAPSAGSGLMSKKGEMILPESGDWAISFEATPFLQYFGNFLNGSTLNAAPQAGFLTSNMTIVGKYFVDEQTAYRGIVRIGFNSNSVSQTIFQDYNPSPVNPPYPTVTDKASIGSHFIGLGAGMEKRKGHTRLQGYYGAELFFWISSGGNDSTMTYGNAYDQTNNAAPTFYNFGNGSLDTYSNLGGGRVISDKPGSIFGISIQGFIGFEYFFMPKISVGAEYTWGINFWSQGQGTVETEQVYTDVNSGKPVDANISYKTGSASHFGVDTGVNSIFGNNTNAGAASLNITFHF